VHDHMCVCVFKCEEFSSMWLTCECMNMECARMCVRECVRMRVLWVSGARIYERMSVGDGAYE
jgi:hypothetical protein